MTSIADNGSGEPAVSVHPRLRFRRTEILGALVFAGVGALGLSGVLPTEQTPGTEIVLRVVVIYFALTFGFRLLGKRELNQLSPFELVTILLIAEIVSPALTAGDESLHGALIGASVLLLMTLATSVLAYRWKWYRVISEAPPSLIIRDGRFQEDVLHRDRLRPDEILSEMHKAGLSSLDQVRLGFIEPDGQLSFVPVDDQARSPPEHKSVV